jgi:hypothetical protein
MSESKSKDHWDKIDIIGRLLSGVVLAVIAVVIKLGADSIAGAQHRGELVRGLIADLTTKGQRTRQDIALITLNHSVGGANPRLVIEIAERLILDTSGYSATGLASGQALTSVAYRILDSLDSDRATFAVEELARMLIQASADPLVRASLRSETVPTPSSTPRTSSAPARALESLSSKVVFLQFQSREYRATMEGLRKVLDTAGFVAPGVEFIPKSFRTSIRYFHPEDSLQAARVAEISASFLTREHLSADSLALLNMSQRGSRVPRGQIEVWLSIKQPAVRR